MGRYNRPITKEGNMKIMKRNAFIRYWVEYERKDGAVAGRWFSDLASYNHFLQSGDVKKIIRRVRM
jgi:hypothetical protein